jgi:ADP-ribosylglycohydrolase/fructose-1,6-bisphosphatase/inositol monophosphatase family enzyme
MVLKTLEVALGVALEAVEAARTILLAECSRGDGPRGEIGKCPADDEAESAIRRVLCEAFPTWGYLGEETGAVAAADGEQHVWFVDPNDGTTSMQRGYRGHAISIGLVRDGVPVLGVVCAVDAPDDEGDLLTWADGCGPIRRNGVELLPRAWRAELRPDDVVGMPQGANRNPVGYLACIAPARFISSPSIAYRLALVATGDFAATLSLNYLRAWDTAAGHALIHAAGGVVVDEHGHDITYPAQGLGNVSRVFAGSRTVVDQLRRQAWDRAPRSGFGESVPPSDRVPVRPEPSRLAHRPGGLSRAQGCLLGQLAGDSLGALVEFKPADTIAARYPDGGPRLLADGGPHVITAGQPTDDSELALSLARCIAARGCFDEEAVAVAYAGWYHGWTHADSPETCSHRWCRPFDMGGTIARALGAVSADDARSGHARVRAQSGASRSSQANGALMRVAPIGIWGAYRDVSVVAEAARADSRLTHPHKVCQDASAVYAVSLAAAIREGLDASRAYAFALDWLRSSDAEPSVVSALRTAESAAPADYLSQQGWVLIALQNAFYQLLHAASVEAGVVATVRAGGDTDTNAAICGALLGAVSGRAAIPEQWQTMVLSCRPMVGEAGIRQPRPAVFWPTDALVLAERLLMS